MAEYVFSVPPEWDNATMQSFLRQHCGLSWRMVVKLKRVEGGMTADGVPLRSIDRLHTGQTVRVQMPEDADKILKLMERYDGSLPFTDKASPELIKEKTGMSKNEFKRAVGNLLKAGKIEILAESIRKR